MPKTPKKRDISREVKVAKPAAISHALLGHDDSQTAAPESGGSSIAAHADHLRYGLSVLNRWSRGENSFADADYTASWRRIAVSEDEWIALRQQLRTETDQWLNVLRRQRDLKESDLNEIIGSIAHLAYHLGAIRQINRSIGGPQATD